MKRLTAVMMGWTMLVAPPAWAVPGFDEIRRATLPSESLLLDRRGNPIQIVRSDMRVRRLEWIALGDISPALQYALILSEDRRFHEHSGVDWKAVGAAAWGNLWNSRTRGASTITMQLAGLIDEDLRNRTGSRSLPQKISQAATALRLERAWRKDQILEAYLNLVAFRGELSGIAALSATLFEKHPSGLNAREAALAAALVRAPNARPNRVADRACALLKLQQRASECSGLRDYAVLVMTRKTARRLDANLQLAPHLAQALITKGQPGQRIDTTLDARVQRYARASLRRHLAELALRNVEDGAVIVLDNATGEVLAWVGSSGDLSRAAEVDGVTALRQAGSTLKPFLYELAIEKRWLTAASILDDTPVNLATASGLYVPRNYDEGYKGPVSVRTALASSLNIPAVRTLVIVSPDRFHERLLELGFASLDQPGGYYGYSLALGSAEVTLRDLSNAYRALANGGRWSRVSVRRDPNAQLAVAHSVQSGRSEKNGKGAHNPMRDHVDVQVMDPAASFIVTDILADRNARAATFGLDSVLANRFWSAVKTGTSKDMRDNWCIGFSQRYTVGVWIGNASGASMWDVSGVSGAAPVWQDVMDFLHRDGATHGIADRHPAAGSRSGRQPAFAPQPPRGIVRQAIRYADHLEAPRHEYFLTGTAQAYFAPATAQRQPTRHAQGLITAPQDGTILALDPDIPPDRQSLRIASLRADARWKLNGKRIGQGSTLNWPLWPGRHRLELLDANNKVLDAIRFEVRGATLPAQALR